MLQNVYVIYRSMNNNSVCVNAGTHNKDCTRSKYTLVIEASGFALTYHRSSTSNGGLSSMVEVINSMSSHKWQLHVGVSVNTT